MVDELLKVKVYVGKDDQKKDYYLNIDKNFLVVDKNKAGQVFLFDEIITSLIKSELDVQVALIDYENKHYMDFEDSEKMFPPIAHNREDVVAMLDFIETTKKARLSLLRQCNVRNIGEYNEKEQNKMSFIFIFVDELSYLMKDKQIDKLLELGKCWNCCGIYLIVATSDVSFDENKVLCGQVKANFVNRICFAVDSKKESKLVIDEGGAENLSGNEVIVSEVNGVIKNTKVSLDFGNKNFINNVND